MGGGTGAAVRSRMTHNHRPVAKTYDEILRSTVPEPDSSWRPSAEIEARAYEGERVLDAEEKALSARVSDKLLHVVDVDVSCVQVEIERNRVSLRGHVRQYRDLPRIENALATVPGVEEIVDYLVVDASHC